ncbi:Hypothetical protein EUBREC_3397 [Agathobacter rectalis ATCC 33656]|uniref:Uncharacterized protein n=1 Tax=Agathobacter rectalis (strain ATCC 33656 / DSM 3377 / JCM 17463 / KCTC 5835 / VPI 0990) TaxID=515619 RepID=C4ZDZ7_AGARV|nr:Hypothetical protein EUBREC_3397 [Agathobacter rectalis ATCC 33656]
MTSGNPFPEDFAAALCLFLFKQLRFSITSGFPGVADATAAY